MRSRILFLSLLLLSTSTAAPWCTWYWCTWYIPVLNTALQTRNPLITVASLGTVLWYEIYTHVVRTPYVHLPPATKLSPATVFVFDLHDVIVRPRYGQRLMILWNSPYKLLFLRHLLNPWFLWDLVRELRTSLPFEGLVQELVTHYPALAPAQETLLQLADAQDFVPGMVSLVNQLHAHGFTLFLFSNIGSTLLERLQQRNAVFFAQFEKVICSSAPHFLSKPDPLCYQLLLDKTNVHPSNIVFIDDRIQNITAAIPFGIQVLLFDSSEILYQELLNAGAFLAH